MLLTDICYQHRSVTHVSLIDHYRHHQFNKVNKSAPSVLLFLLLKISQYIDEFINMSIHFNSTTNGGPYWIGLRKVNNNWSWWVGLSGLFTSGSWSNWGMLSGLSDCASVTPYGKWIDSNYCSTDKLHYICEGNISFKLFMI